MAKTDDEKKITCIILRDYWDADGIRHRAGTAVDVPVEAALDGVESGILARKK